MTEPTQQEPTEIEALRTEIATLRQVNSELVAKAAKRKDRVAELEATLTERDNQVTAVNGQLKAIEIDAPLKRMADTLSNDSALFLEIFGKDYQVQLVDGALALRDKQGNPVKDKDGKAVVFERESLLRHLSDEKHPHSNFYSRLLIASRASGGAAPTRTIQVTKPKPRIQFGLR
jgi:hypothetical protein